MTVKAFCEEHRGETVPVLKELTVQGETDTPITVPCNKCCSTMNSGQEKHGGSHDLCLEEWVWAHRY